MNLFLFANFFPYKKAEPFLVNEFEFAKKAAESVCVFTLYGKPSQSIIPLTSQIKLLPPVFESSGSKRKILIKGIFNLSSFNFHLKELFSKGILFQPKKLYGLFTSLCVTRAVLSSNAYKELVKEIRSAKDPVLYFYWGDNLAWIIPYLRQDAENARIVIRLHGSDLYEHMKNNYAPLRELIFSKADQIFTVSENGQKYLQQKYPLQYRKIKIARLGVSDNGINPPEGADITVVSVSNVIPLKRVRLIFEALQLINLNITWHHFGDGPLFEELKNRILKSRPGLKVKLHGFVANNTILQFYKTNHVNLFINVSTSEGVPVSIMEALSFGIPVIATNVGGTSELVNEKNGKLLKVDLTAEELSGEMAHFLNLSKEEQATIRKNARKQFEENAMADRNYSAFYKQLAENDFLSANKKF